MNVIKSAAIYVLEAERQALIVAVSCQSTTNMVRIYRKKIHGRVV